MKPRPKPKSWRALRHGSHHFTHAAIIDERGDLIADCYSNQEDALVMAASRELLEACKYLLKNTFERGIEIEQLKKAQAAIDKAHGRKP